MHRPTLHSVNVEVDRNQPLNSLALHSRSWTFKLDALLGLAKVLTVVVFMLSLMGYWGVLGWAADLASSFKLQYAVLSGCSLLVFLLRPSWAWLLLAVLAFGMNVSELMPAYTAAPRAAAWEDARVDSRFTLLQMNVKRENRHFDKVIEVIHTFNPDVITLNEVNRNWLDQLQPAFLKYPYSVTSERDDPYGIAIYSRIPLVKTKIYSFLKRRPHSQAAVPSALAAFRLNGALVTILATHGPPPITPGYYEARNDELAEIAEHRNALGSNLLLAGDLNLTPYSETFKSFIAETALHDSRLGFGNQSSWPGSFSFAGLPLDHVLLSDSMVTLKRQLGPDIGSDHLPVFAEIGVLHPPDSTIDSSALGPEASQPPETSVNGTDVDDFPKRE